MKKYTPKILIKFIIKEFSFSVFIFICIFSSLILITGLIEETVFFKDKNIEDIFLKSVTLTFLKIPTQIINFFPFIILFGSIFFFVKLMRNNEVLPISLSGFSNNFLILVPSFFSFFIGIFIIGTITPLSAQLTKFYEFEKQKYTNNDNLIIFKSTGIWIKEKYLNEKRIIRIDKVNDQSFKNFENITIYKFNNNDFYERIDAKKASVEKSTWVLYDLKKNNISKSSTYEKEKMKSNINFQRIKNLFINPNTVSMWNAISILKLSRERGYYGQEIVIMINKHISLPFLLFSIVIFSTLFTLNIQQNFNNFIYVFFGILLGLVIYFFSDASIALGKTGRVPLILSVWLPTLTILISSCYSLIKDD